MEKGLSPVRILYHDLHKQISQEELKAMKYLLGPRHLSETEREKLKTVQELLTTLEQRGHIASGKLDLLKQMLKNIGRKPLVHLVEEFEKKLRIQTSPHPDPNGRNTALDGGTASLQRDIDERMSGEYSEFERPTEVILHEDSEDSLECSVKNISGPKCEGTQALEFKNPAGVVLKHDRIVICDHDNGRVYVLDKRYKLLNLLKFDGQFAKTFQPWDVAVIDNHFFITDRGNKQAVVCDKTSKVIRTFANNKNIQPLAIAVMPRFVFVTDHKGHSLIKYTKYGGFVSKVGRKGKSPGEFRDPVCVAVNSLNQVFVSDFHNHRIQVFDSHLKWLFIFRSSGPFNAMLKSPFGMSVDNENNVYVCERGRSRVVKFNRNGDFMCSLFDGELRNQVRYMSVETDNDDRVIRIVVTERSTNVLKEYKALI